ncbi:MAG: type II toxin-antitoxin system Phd/YefM family antitoxin [Nocardioidaceae bacterium]|nr:type II toxin-antitoxin system Phd/YefM family antitoxin [Nocardioidaceae bacterium]
MTTVNIHEAKTHLSRLLEQVAAGERVVIARAGTPVAELVKHEPRPLVFGGLRGQLSFDDEHFDDVDNDILEMFYGPDAAS